MAKVLFQHYLWLINKLQTKPMTLAELSESFERSSLYDGGKGLLPRTLYNWREKIDELFGIQITYKNDAYHLVNFEHLKENSPQRWLVQSLAVNESVHQSKELKNRILLEDIPSGEAFLTPIIDAMKEGQVIRLTYRKFTDSADSAPFDVEPFCVKVNLRRWYLLGRVLTPSAQKHRPSEYDCFGALKIYALDRIQTLEITEQKFTFPKEFDAEAFFASHFGVCIGYDIPQQVIRLRVEKGMCNYLRTLPLHPSQVEVETTPEYAVFEYCLHPTIDFFRAILSFGADVEVLSPPQLREQVSDEAMIMNHIYEL